MPHKLAVIGIDGDGHLGAADRNVKLLAVHQLRREPSVDINDHVIDRCTLRRVRRRRVPVVDVTKTIERGGHLPAIIELHQRTPSIDGFDCGELAVGDAKGAVRRPELDAVPSCDGALFFAEDLNAEQADRSVFDTPPTRHVNCEQVGVAMDRLDPSVAAFANRKLFAAAGEANHVAFFVVVGDRSLRPGEGAVYEDRVLSPGEGDMPADSQRRPNRFVQLAPFLV